MKRECIYPKDVQWITGKSERQSRNIISQIKKEYNKQKHQVVTIEELCEYLGLEVARIAPMIK